MSNPQNLNAATAAAYAVSHIPATLRVGTVVETVHEYGGAVFVVELIERKTGARGGSFDVWLESNGRIYGEW